MEDRYAPIRLKNQLCFPLYLCSKEITQRYKPLLADLDLTYTQYIVMMYFWEAERSTEKEASRVLVIDPSTLTPVIKKLIAKGYLQKEKNSSDERSYIIELTEKGSALKDAALEIPAQMCDCIGLSSDELIQLGSLISKILKNIENTKYASCR